MKTAEAKRPPARAHAAIRPAEPFFQPKKDEAFFAEAPEAQTAPLQHKTAFEGDGEEPPVPEVVQAKTAFEGDGEEGQAEDRAQRKPAFEGEDAAVQTKPDSPRARTPGNGVAAANPFFTTSGDGGFFSSAGAPFFAPTRVQAKLTIGPPDDRYEREADDMAERVVNGPDKTVAPPPPVQQRQEDDEEAVQPSLFERITPLVQRQEGDEEAVQPHCAACQHEQRLQHERNPGATVQAKCAACEAKEQQEDGRQGDAAVQTKPSLQRQADDTPPASDDLESRLHSSKGGGQPLDETTRSQMEAGFGADFSGVRVHTDRQAVRMNNELGAQAFTHGGDVYFNENKYQPTSSDGQRLLAHELTHTVQQGASVRKKPLSRTGGPRIQRGPLASLINRVARNVPGYTLLTVIIGKNPITGDAVPRTATNLLDGLLGLLPGGALLADKLKETGALQEAGAWISTEIDTLGITFSYIKELVSQAWDELSIWNSWGTNLGIVKRIFGAPYRRVKAFVGRIAGKIKEFIFRGALKAVGAPVDKVMGVLNKGADVITRIISDPIGFFRNLALSVGGGIKRFSGNIKKHLISGLIDWLTGAMAEVPITLPKKFDLKGILDLVLQILGLTWARIRAKLVKRVGERAVSIAEKSVDIIRRLVTEGPIALWEMLKEKAAEIKNQVMEGIRNWVITQIVKQAVIKLLSFVNPAGALLQAVLGLYNLVMFLIENVQRIVDMVTSVFSSIGEIARGAIGKASEFIEKTMARTVPIILNFLARLIGLSGIGKTVSGIITKIRKPIDKVVDKALDFMVRGIKKLIKKGKGLAKKAKDKALAALMWWKQKKTFKDKAGTPHKLFFQGKGKAARLVVASETIPLEALVTKLRPEVAKDANKKHAPTLAKMETLIGDIKGLGLKMESAASNAEKQKHYDALTQKLGEAITTLEPLMPLIGGPAPPAAILPAFKNSVRGNSFEAQFISKTTTGGQDASVNKGGTMPGWRALANSVDPVSQLSVRKKYNFVKMHLLHDELGGKATDSNLTPAISPINTNFYFTMEKWAVEDVFKHKKVLWYNVKIGFWDSAGPQFAPYPKSVEAMYGYMEFEGNTWVKKDGPKGKDRWSNTDIKKPVFGTDVRVFDLNAISPKGLLGLDIGRQEGEYDQVSRAFAEWVRDERRTKAGDFTGYGNFVDRMRERKKRAGRKKSAKTPPDVDKALAFIDEAHKQGKIEPK